MLASRSFPCNALSNAVSIRRRRFKKSNPPARLSTNRPQHPVAGKLEGSAKSEKSQRFDAPQQPPRAMAGTQRYLRYIIFALIVRLLTRPSRSSPPLILRSALFSSSSYPRRRPFPRQTGQRTATTRPQKNLSRVLSRQRAGSSSSNSRKWTRSPRLHQTMIKPCHPPPPLANA